MLSVFCYLITLCKSSTHILIFPKEVKVKFHNPVIDAFLLESL